MGRPSSCCGGICSPPVVTCEVIIDRIYYTVTNAKTALIRHSSHDNSNLDIFINLILDINGNAEGWINISDISLTSAVAELDIAIGYYNFSITASNDCGQDSCQISCDSWIRTFIRKKYPDCYVLTNCSQWGLPSTPPCYAEGPIIYEWYVQISDGDRNGILTSITVNGSNVVATNYDEAANKYSGEFQVDRCDLPELFTIAATFEDCGTQIVSDAVFAVTCMERKNSFILEVNLSDFSTSSHNTYPDPVTNSVIDSTDTFTGLSGFNGTYIFPIECYPIFNSFANKYDFIRTVSPNPIRLSGEIVRRFIRTSYFNSYYGTNISATFYEDYTYTYNLQILPYFPCTPLSTSLKSLVGYSLLNGNPYSTFNITCATQSFPACQGFHASFNTRQVGNTGPDISCHVNNTFYGYTPSCFNGSSYMEFWAQTQGNTGQAAVYSTIGTLRAYYDCL